MSKIIANIEHDFFESNQEIRYFDSVIELINVYGKERASRIMWAVYLVTDPNSDFHSISIDDRRKIIAKNYLKEEDFNWDDELINGIIDEYPEWFLSGIEKRYRSLSDLLDRTVSKVEKLKVENDKDFDKINTFLRSIKPIFEGLLAVKKSFDTEKETSKNIRGEDQPGWLAKKSM